MRIIDADALLKEDFTDRFIDDYDNTVFETIIENAPTVDIKTEVAREIFESVRANCVDNDGNFLYGAFMNLQLDTMNKYKKEGVGE